MAIADRHALDLVPPDSERLALLCGPQNAHIRAIETTLDVRILNRGHHFEIEGDDRAADAAKATLDELYAVTSGGDISPERAHVVARSAANEREPIEADVEMVDDDVVVKTRTGLVRGRGPNQRRYLSRLRANDLSFGIGPAGTGKTFLAVAAAVDALENERVERVVLVRPAVEAGERLGFLPGDLAQKIDPYLRPLYDGLYEMLGFDRVGRLIDNNVIEIAPLAYMRGRTLNAAFIILDEAQNTTVEQMKMFLTRIGFGSTAVVTGDTTQVDLPHNQRSGLSHAVSLLSDIEGISVTRFAARDVVRHPLVQKIVQAYETNSRESGA